MAPNFNQKIYLSRLRFKSKPNSNHISRHMEVIYLMNEEKSLAALEYFAAPTQPSISVNRNAKQYTTLYYSSIGESNDDLALWKQKGLRITDDGVITPTNVSSLDEIRGLIGPHRLISIDPDKLKLLVPELSNATLWKKPAQATRDLDGKIIDTEAQILARQQLEQIHQLKLQAELHEMASLPNFGAF